jgi:dienelactone hydrolase
MKFSTRLVLCVLCATGCAVHVDGGTGGDVPDGGRVDAGAGGGDGPRPSGEVVVTSIPQLPGSKLMVRPDAIPAPGIVMLHGSEGGAAGFIDEDGRRLAEEGFAVLSFCWFGCPGKPSTIERIRLEDTVAAITWLRANDAVRGGPVGLYGLSRGAEQAVLLASLVRNTSVIATVAVHAASDTVVAAYDPQSEDGPWEMHPQTGEWVFAPAWTWQGQPLYGERRSFSAPGPRIRVEDYPGAMFLSHGTNDDLWPVTRTQNIERARDNAGRLTEAHYWQGQGHIIEDPAMVERFLVSLTQFYDRELRP